MLDITPCRVSSFSVPYNPPDVVLDRTSESNGYPSMMQATYHPRFYNSQPSKCPVLGYEMTEEDGSAFIDQNVTSASLNVPAQAGFTI